MGKYCPRWVYMTVVAQVCFDYIKLNLGAGLLVISNKYDDGLKEIYDDKDLPKVDTVAMEFLRICSDLKINHDTEHLISDYFQIFFSVIIYLSTI